MTALFQKLLGVLFVIIVLFSFTPVAFAQTPETSPYNADVPNTLHTGIQGLFIEVASALTCQLAGIDPTNPQGKCLGIDQKTGKLGYVNNGNGVIGAMGGMIARLSAPPIHTTDYIAYMTNSFGVTKPSYAIGNGTGFDTVSPLIGLWSSFRDIVYMLFVIVFIFTGLTIMLRLKIDPRTVMSIENQLPKIIICILLVTFSFSFVGFFIDMMWVFTYTTINILATKDIGPEGKSNIDTEGMIHDIYTPPIGFLNATLGNNCQDAKANGSGVFCIALTSGESVQRIIYSLFSPTNAIDKNQAGCTLLGDTSSDQCKSTSNAGQGSAEPGIVAFITSVLAGIVSWTIGVLGILVVVIALLWAMLQLWIALLKAYIYILLHTVLSPFWMIGGLLPGSPVSFSGWLREMISSLSVYPVTIAMFVLGKVFMDAFGSVNQTVYLPLIGNPGDTKAWGALIGMGIIFITPQVVTMMKELLKAPPFKYTFAIGQALGIGQKVLTSGPKAGWNMLWRPYDHYSHRPAGILRTTAYRIAPPGTALRRFLEENLGATQAHHGG